MIAEWVQRLSEPSPATNGLPTCPFAKRAFDVGKVTVVRNVDIKQIIDLWTDEFDLVLMIVDRGSIAPDAAREMIERLNRRYEGDDFVVMVDHPDRPFIVDGRNNSNGESVVFFIQRKSVLDRASTALRPTGYYRKWPDGEG